MSLPNTPDETIRQHWLYTRIETSEEVIIRYERSYLILGGMVAGWIGVFTAMLIDSNTQNDLILAGIGLAINLALTIVEIAANWKATWETFDGYQRNAVKTTGYGFSPRNPYTVIISKKDGPPPDPALKH